MKIIKDPNSKNFTGGVMITEKDLMEKFIAYRNGLIDECIRLINLFEDDELNFPWDDLSDHQNGQIYALGKIEERLEKLKITQEE